MNTQNTLLQYSVKTLLLFAFLVGANDSCFAHTDRVYERTFGNVSINITTGFGYEEIEQTFMLGNYVQMLSKELKYNAPVRIVYNHVYVEPRQPEYYISMGNTIRILNNPNTINNEVTDKGTLYIRIYASNLNFTESIIMVDFAIQNKTKIKENQIRQVINKDYSYWKNDVVAYPLEKLVEVREKKLSKMANRVLSQKIDRPVPSAIGYYCQNDRMHIVAKQTNKPDELLVSIPDVFWFEAFEGGRSAIVFDTDTTFYYAEVNENQKASISKRQVIRNRQDKYYPFECKKVDANTVFITYQVNNFEIVDLNNPYAIPNTTGGKEITVYYDTKMDRLILDSNKLNHEN